MFVCIFRCLAVEQEWDEASSSLVSPHQQVTLCLYSLWQGKREDFDDVGSRDFPGVTLGDPWELEELFDVSILWTSGSNRTWKLHLNIEQDHFSLIIDIAMYAKSFTSKTPQHTHVLQEMQPYSSLQRTICSHQNKTKGHEGICCRSQTLLSIQDHLQHRDICEQPKDPRRHGTMHTRPCTA